MTRATGNSLFGGKAGRHNSTIIRSLLNGPRTAYDLYKQNEDTLEYSTSNRRLRSLEQEGLVARADENLNPTPGGRKKIHYALTLKGSMAALLLEPTLTEEEFVTLLESYEATNPSYRLFRRLVTLGLPAKSVWGVFAEQLKESIESGRVNLNASDKVVEVSVAFELDQEHWRAH